MIFSTAGTYFGHVVRILDAHVGFNVQFHRYGWAREYGVFSQQWFIPMANFSAYMLVCPD
jgi:hypothetical protein